MKTAPRRLPDFRYIGCNPTAAIHFLPSFWPIATAMSLQIRQKLSSLGSNLATPLFENASMPKVRQSPSWWSPFSHLRRLAWTLLLALLPLAAQAAAWYDSLYVGLGSWSAEAGLQYMNGKQTSTAANGDSASSKTNAFGESMRVGNSGFYVLSPLLFTGGLSVDLQLNQDKGSGSGIESSTQGRAAGYAFDGTFLSEKPYPVMVAAHRNQTRTLQSYGGLSVGSNKSRSVTFNLHPDGIFNDWGYPWTEGKMEISQEHNQNTTNSFGQSLVLDEESKTFNFNASKGFETADLQFFFQNNDRVNHQFNQGNFQSKAAQLNYSLDFGPTFNRQFNAKLGYQSRNGQSSASTWTNSESLHLDHSKKMSTDYSYDAVQLTSGNATSLAQNVRSSVSHQLYQNLHTTAGINAGQTRLLSGSTRAWGGQVGQGYNHSLPGKGTFIANWSAGFQSNRNQLDSPTVQVTDEAHTPPTPLTARIGFLLNQRYVDLASIRIFNVKGGGRLPLSQTADFDVLTEGNQTRIVPLATSLLVADGDPLLVSYTYQVDPNLESNTRSRSYGLGVDYRWINLSYGHAESNQTPVNQNTSKFLQSSRQDYVQMGLQGVVMGKAANANATLEDNAGDNLANRQLKFRSGLVWNPQSDLHANVDALLSLASHTLPDSHTTQLMSVQSALHWYDRNLVFGLHSSRSSYQGLAPHTDNVLALRAALDWQGDDDWMHSVSTDWSHHSDTSQPADTLMQVSAKSTVTLGKLSLSMNAALGQSQRGGNRSVNRSFNISAVRQF